MTIIPYFDPILGKLRNSDVALISVASLIVPDPLVVNNLIVNSNATISGLLRTTNLVNSSTISTNLLYANKILASTISTGYLGTSRTDFNTSYVTNGEPVGSLYWNTDRDTLELLTNSGAVQVGEDLFFHCINQTGSTINKGTAVMYAGALGASGKIKIAPAIADGTYPALVMLGVTKEDISNGDEGKVLVIGELAGFDTSVFGAEQILYLDPANAGGFTTTEPSAPNLKYAMAATLDSKSNGNIVVRAIYNPSFRELNDVNFVSLASGQIIMANATGVWTNQTLSYTQLSNLPSLGSLAVLNSLSYTSLSNLPSLGSLAIISDVVSPLNLSGTTLSLSQASISHNSLGDLTTGDPHTQYALLAGRSGGQTLHGGSGANNLLILRGTSANGNTATSNAIRMGVGNGGGTYALDLRHNGTINHTVNTTTNADGYTLNQTITGTSGDSIGAFFSVSDTEGGVKTIFGHRARARFAPANVSQTLTGIQATSNQVVVTGHGTVGFVETLTTNADITNSYVNELRLLRFFTPAMNGTASIGTLIGMDIPDLTVAQPNAYAISSDGGKSYHKGNFGFGVFNPQTQIHYSGDMTGEGAVFASTVSINILEVNAGVFASQVSIRNLNGNNIFFNDGTIQNFNANSVNSGDFTGTGQVFMSNGSPATPAYTFSNASNTGIYYNATATAIGFAVAGSVDLRITDSQLLTGAGTAALPAYSFIGDPDTGIYNSSANTMVFSTGGVIGMYLNPNNRLAVNTSAAAAGQTDIRQTNTTAVIPVLYLNQTDLSEEFIHFQTTIAAGNPIQIATSLPSAPSHKIRVSVNGTLRFIYAYAT